jgi:dTDP-4-dehydrorhamnose 3,5-epimerase
MELREFFPTGHIAQVNVSVTTSKGTIRGMHFQHPPHAETKMVSCLRGEVFDVAVDLRTGSPTFLQWHAEILSESNHRSLMIPAGFAHGFQTLTDNSQLFYVHSCAYAPDFEDGISPFDPMIAINWPLQVSDISEKDRHRTLLKTNFTGIKL